MKSDKFAHDFDAFVGVDLGRFNSAVKKALAFEVSTSSVPAATAGANAESFVGLRVASRSCKVI